MRALLFAAACLAAGSARAGAAKKAEISHKKFYEEAALRRPKIAKAKELAKWLKEGSVVLLDLRSPAAFGRSHIKGAANLPATELTDEAVAKVVPSTSTRLVVYCDDNLMPTRRIALTTFGHPALVQLGYERTYRLEDLWSSKDCREKGATFSDGCPKLLPMEGSAKP